MQECKISPEIIKIKPIIYCASFSFNIKLWLNIISFITYHLYTSYLHVRALKFIVNIWFAQVLSKLAQDISYIFLKNTGLAIFWIIS